VKAKHVKPGYLGPAFYEWMKHLEMMEALVVHDRVLPGDKKRLAKGYSFNDELWPSTEPEFGQVKRHELRGKWGNVQVDETVFAMMPVDAWLAQLVRSSVKYRVTVATLNEIRERYDAEMTNIFCDMVLELPYDPMTIVFENAGPKNDDVICNITATTAADRSRAGPLPGEDVNYPALGIEEGDEFLSASFCFHRAKGVDVIEADGTVRTFPAQKLSHCPVEVHFNKGRPVDETTFINAIAPGCEPTIRGKALMDDCRVLLLNFLATFQLQSALRRRQPGKTPAMMADEGGRRRPKHRSKFNKPMFEHFVVELEVDQPDPEQTGTTRAMHHKRQHQVRGHLRHYKSGLTAWVKPHWRGNKDLGVIRKDFEVTLHEDDVA
jgi:hypothetical protein